METKRKTPLQLQALEDFYSEGIYPTQSAMEDYAASLGLTYKQVRGWFAERRRKEKRESGTILVSSSKKVPIPSGKNGVGAASRKILKRDSLVGRARISPSSKCKCPHLLESDAIKEGHSRIKNRVVKRKKKPILLQDLLTTDYILKKVFRKDGPPLGVEFDFLPSGAFFHFRDSRNSYCAGQEYQKAPKRRKVLKPAIVDHQDYTKKSGSVKKHGIGKGLMTVWRATNPDAGNLPTGVDFADREITWSISNLNFSVTKTTTSKEISAATKACNERRLGNKLQEKRKPPSKRKEVVCNIDENQKQPPKDVCKLALEGVISQEYLDQFASLMDDEELELRELQAGPNPLTCSAHFATNRLHGCSLCKDLLAKFPPSSVKMKQPFCMQPWDSSPEIVKKLFKVFHFLCTYAVIVDICPFTLDEFTQAFHDKDSCLLGKVHVALLKLLLSDVETELSRGFLPHLSKSCKFLGLLHSVERQEFVVGFWKRSLNSLTWTEILRQVFVAAGFGSKPGTLRNEALSKEANRMVKYGLHPGTLKGKLFSILSEQGNNGMKVPDLAKSLQIAELNLASTSDELELLISSTLSSDITLFEKISSSAYRLRINFVTEEADNFQSDTEDSGSVDDDSKDSGTCSSSDDSDYDSGNSNLSKLKRTKHRKSRNNMLTVYTEIDESHPGEVWLLGLMEGEYSDLSIEEKLNALVALVDLLSAGSSIRMEDPTKVTAECIPNMRHCGSGAKIKRSSTMKHSLAGPSWGHVGQIHSVSEACTSLELRPVDSSASISKFCGMEQSASRRKDAKEIEGGFNTHPMQSVFLGSDRRYNRYWLFLGPCNANDPCHKRVYFESSEDGHWEVIDTEEALCALLSVLDDRGTREALLLASLEKREAFLCQAMSNSSGIRSSIQSDQSELDMIRDDSSSPVSDVDNNLCLTNISQDPLASSGAIIFEAGKKGEEREKRWSRLQEFDSWIWNSFYLDLNAVKHSKKSYLDSLTRCGSCHDLYWRDEKHCKICHTTFELDFDLEERYAIHVATCREKEDRDIFPKYKVLSSQLQSLKAAGYAIESVMPEDALVGAWTKSAHKLWVKRLRRTSSLAELLQVLTDFVGAINEDWFCQCNITLGSNNVLEDISASFPTIPQTSSAVALWLVKLDAIIAPYLESVSSEKKREMGTRFNGKRVLKD
ncbi:hypothetical protein L1049_019611 [Liquidambar formosana]|uniref:Homeobox-DDT domain protein RLT3 n=1 Tax=Liquidambar formosana TaxID=63359 RepID=A0AAP0SBL7_LIQFO